MRRLKVGYLFSIIIWIVLGFTFIVLNKEYNILSKQDSNLILGIISVAISILSLGLATMRLPEFKGKVECWNNKSQAISVNNSEKGYEKGNYKLISFKIQNRKKEPIRNMVINFRIPSIIYRNKTQDNLKNKEIIIKDSAIYTSDAIKFLGVNQGDCELTFEHHIKIQKMRRGNIYVTVAGDNIRPTTFKINKDLGEKIDISNSRQPLKLPKVK